jgi:hypothetical protein
VVLRVRLACIGQDGKPARLPARLRTALMALAGVAGQDDSGIIGKTLIRERV